MNRSMLLILAIALLATGGAGLVLGSMYIERLRNTSGSVSEPDPEYQRVPADADSPWMTGFTLTERSGKQVAWADFQGKVTVTSFFFSSCPAVSGRPCSRCATGCCASSRTDAAFSSRVSSPIAAQRRKSNTPTRQPCCRAPSNPSPRKRGVDEQS